MNAFVQILKQLFEAVDPETWNELSCFPFPLQEEDRSKLSDLVLFHQTARQVFGIAWLEFKRLNLRLVYPFLLSRYQPDGALITLAPWSIKDATHDERFYTHMNAAFIRQNPFETALGGKLQKIRHPGQQTKITVAIETEQEHAVVRVDSIQAFKIFKVFQTHETLSLEGSILEHLNSTSDFSGSAALVSTLRYHPKEQAAGAFDIGLSCAYALSVGNLWSQMLVLLQEARVPSFSSRMDMESAGERCVLLIQRAGRLISGFHRAMLKAKPKSMLAPATLEGQELENWKLQMQEYCRELANRATRRLEDMPQKLQRMGASIPEMLEQVLLLVSQIQRPGVLIFGHGHLHLGQILLAPEDRLTLLNFQAKRLGLHAFQLERQSCLDDYVSFQLSLQFAWGLMSHEPDDRVFAEIIDPDSEYGRTLASSAAAVVPKVTQERLTLAGLHEAFSKSYFQGLRDDPMTSVLFPVGEADFSSMMKIYSFLRALDELSRNSEPGNPKALISLRAALHPTFAS